MTPPTSMNSIQDTLRNCGLKASSQRVAILTYLQSVDTHPTADQMYEALTSDLPSLSRGTVYNTLKTLQQHGLVHELTVQKGESRYDGNISCHGHFSCTQCGELFDLPLQEHSHSIPDGFQLQTQQHFFYGLCPNCFSEDN